MMPSAACAERRCTAPLVEAVTSESASPLQQFPFGPQPVIEVMPVSPAALAEDLVGPLRDVLGSHRGPPRGRSRRRLCLEQRCAGRDDHGSSPAGRGRSRLAGRGNSRWRPGLPCNRVEHRHGGIVWRSRVERGGRVWRTLAGRLAPPGGRCTPRFPLAVRAGIGGLLRFRHRSDSCGQPLSRPGYRPEWMPSQLVWKRTTLKTYHAWPRRASRLPGGHTSPSSLIASTTTSPAAPATLQAKGRTGLPASSTLRRRLQRDPEPPGSRRRIRNKSRSGKTARRETGNRPAV